MKLTMLSRSGGDHWSSMRDELRQRLGRAYKISESNSPAALDTRVLFLRAVCGSESDEAELTVAHAGRAEEAPPTVGRIDHQHRLLVLLRDEHDSVNVEIEDGCTQTIPRSVSVRRLLRSLARLNEPGPSSRAA